MAFDQASGELFSLVSCHHVRGRDCWKVDLIPKSPTKPCPPLSGLEVCSCPWPPGFPFRRPAGSDEEALVFVWSEGAFRFTDAAGTLRPFTPYEYQVRARNSRGSVASLWTSARTLEAPPQDLMAPWAHATGAHSVLLNWTEPGSPNGIIFRYHVVYQERPEDPTFIIAPVRAFTVEVSTEKDSRYLRYQVNMLRFFVYIWLIVVVFFRLGVKYVKILRVLKEAVWSWE